MKVKPTQLKALWKSMEETGLYRGTTRTRGTCVGGARRQLALQRQELRDREPITIAAHLAQGRLAETLVSTWHLYGMQNGGVIPFSLGQRGPDNCRRHRGQSRQESGERTRVCLAICLPSLYLHNCVFQSRDSMSDGTFLVPELLDNIKNRKC